MKKIILLINFLFISIISYSQVSLGGAIQQTSVTDNYPVWIDSTGYGGYRVCADTIVRNSIRSSFRSEGMMVYCINPAKWYYLNGGTTNEYWVEFTGGGGGGGTPAGSNGSIQLKYNNAFYASPKLSYDTTKFAFTAGYRTGISGHGSTVFGGYGGLSNMVNSQNSMATGQSNLLENYMTRGTYSYNSLANGYANKCYEWMNFASGSSNIVDGKIASAIGNSNVSSAHDGIAGGNQCYTGRKIFWTTNFGRKYLAGYDTLNYVLIPTSYYDVRNYFPYAGIDSLNSRYNYGVLADVKGNVYPAGFDTAVWVGDSVVTINDLDWALHSICILKGSKEGELSFAKIAKSVYEADSGTRVYYYGDRPFNSLNGILSSYSSEVKIKSRGDSLRLGNGSIALGRFANVAGYGAASIGFYTRAYGEGAVAIGYNSLATKQGAVSIGGETESNGYYSFSSGFLSKANGKYSTAIGFHNTASGQYSTAFGYFDTASGEGAIAFGYDNDASGNISFAVGESNTSSGFESVTLGRGNVASGYYSLAIGMFDTASNNSSFAGGRESSASGVTTSFSFGYKTRAVGENSIAMGENTLASGRDAMATGRGSKATANYTNALGFLNTASANGSTAIGYSSTASGLYSTALGFTTTASGESSTTMGAENTASGNYSTAMGRLTTASGDYTTTLGLRTTAHDYAELAIGQYNVLSTGNQTAYDATNTAFKIGNGTSDSARSDAFKVLFNGNTTVGGTLDLKTLSDGTSSDSVLTAMYSGGTYQLKRIKLPSSSVSNILLYGTDTVASIDTTTASGRNIKIGKGAGKLLFNNNYFTNSYNLLLGYNAGYNMYNVSIGQPSIDNNIFIGKDAGYMVSGCYNNLSANIAIGTQAMREATGGYYNIAIGLNSGRTISTGSDNILLGNSAGDKITSGNYNTNIGHRSGYNLTGSQNVFLGYYSGAYLTTYSYKLILNSLNRINIAGDTTNSIIYGHQNTTSSNQRLYLNSNVITKHAVINTPSAIDSITAANGITATLLNKKVVRLFGALGAVDITATPQIADGTDGQIIEIWGESDTKTVKLDDGNGLQLSGGVSFTLGLGDVITLRYFSNVDVWREISRSDN